MLIRSFARQLACRLIMAGLAACASPPTERLYTLSAEPLPADKAPLPTHYSITVGPVVLPELIDRPQLVVQVAANQVTRLEQERWAAPLKSEIAQVVAANLSRLLGTSRVGTRARNVIADPDYQVTIDVQRFDATPGEAVMVEALWAVRARGSPAHTGRSQVSERTSGSGYAAVVAAQSRALARVSQEIAEAIRAQKAPGLDSEN